MRKTLLRFLSVSCTAGCALVLAACGGGGGSGSSEPPQPANVRPIADAGPPQTAEEGQTVTLAGTATDSDGTIELVTWRQLDGVTVNLSQSGNTASFVVPDIDVDSTATFQLMVTDDRGASDSDSVTVDFEARVSVSGSVFPATGIDSDGDVNDIGTPLARNNDFESAQTLGNPVLLGGYANEPGTGDDSGQLEELGDTEDFYLIDAVEGQTVSLFIESERPFINDLDLELYDPAFSLDIPIDASFSTTAFEQLTIPADGEYYIAVVAFRGASNYILSIGQAAAAPTGWRADALVLSDSFNAGQAVVRFDDDEVSAKGGLQSLASKTGMVPLGGAAGRSRLIDTTSFLDGDDGGGGRYKDMARRLREGKFTTRAERSSAGEERNRSGDKAGSRHWSQLARLDTLLAIKALRARDDVIHASPNYLHEPSITPNDEFIGLQWHYPAISLPAAWDLTQGDRNPSVIVAVIDTGVLLGHPDFAGKLVPGFDFISNPGNARDGDGIDSNPDDPGDLGNGGSSSFHGTHVAGTVGALTNNATGVAGSGWETLIMPLRALGQFGGSTFDIDQAIRFAAGLPNDSGTVPAQRADVINLSLGGAGFSQASQNLINEVRAAGVVVVAAAGNSSTSAPSFPAAYDGVISVSAVDINNNRTGYSNFGSTIDLAAPGGNTGADVNGDGFGDGVLSTIGDDSGGSIRFGYGFLQGTSMAAPHVAGVIALMRAVDPNLTPAAIDSLIAAGSLSDDLGTPGRDNSFGHGLINAFDAVVAAVESSGGELPDPTPVLIATPPALNFGVSLVTQPITVSNGGTGDLAVGAPTVVPDVAWLSVDSTGADASGVGPYQINVERDGLDPGTFQAEVEFTSNGGDFAVPVIMQVADGDTPAGNAGNHFILLIDDATGDVVGQSEPGLVIDGVTYAFNDISPGTYIIIGGTDNDSDGFICDAAEACGAFPVLDPLALQTVTIEGNRDDLDFISTFNGELATPSSAAGGGAVSVANAVRSAMGGRGIPVQRGANVFQREAESAAQAD
ncbi:MAG: S8 family serine peptidase [Pseudomonadota bacterium]